MVDYLNNNTNEKFNVNDGFFDIKYQKDGIYLTVYPPLNDGRKIDSREIIDTLNRKHIRGFKKEFVEIVTLKPNKVPVKIADPEEELVFDATASVIIAPDKMRAFIRMTAPEGGKTLTAKELLNILHENKVVYGINEGVLERLEKSPVYGENVCVAEGLLPVNGVNGSINFYFDLKRESKPTILEDGRVDYRELNLIQSVNKDQLLCRLVPPKNGIKGFNVFGVEIPARDGKPANLPRGKNVVVSSDGQDLLAGIDGQVNYIDGKVSVFSTYEVRADVDNTTGNISFIGNVVIRGSVLSGFTINAGGSIEVWGVVEAAVLIAGGDIILRRGMQGSGKGVLSSGGNIIARYIENSNIEARNDIKAEAIMHSNVKCGNKLELSGRKGLFVGGSCRVGKEIVAKVIGSYMATMTDIEVGIDPTIRDRTKALRDEIAGMENDIEKAEQAITILRKLEKAGLLTPEKQELLTKSLRTETYLTNRIVELKDELQYLDSRLLMSSEGKVKCYDTIFPGTRITIGTSSMNVKENLSYCTLYSDGVDIRISTIS